MQPQANDISNEYAPYYLLIWPRYLCLFPSSTQEGLVPKDAKLSSIFYLSRTLQ